MNKLNVIIIFPCVQTPFLTALNGGFCLGSASSLVQNSPPVLMCFIRLKRPKTPPRHGYHRRRQNLGPPFEKRRLKPWGTQI